MKRSGVAKTGKGSAVGTQQTFLLEIERLFCSQRLILCSSDRPRQGYPRQNGCQSCSRHDIPTTTRIGSRTSRGEIAETVVKQRGHPSRPTGARREIAAPGGARRRASEDETAGTLVKQRGRPSRPTVAWRESAGSGGYEAAPPGTRLQEHTSKLWLSLASGLHGARECRFGYGRTSRDTSADKRPQLSRRGKGCREEKQPGRLADGEQDLGGTEYCKHITV